MLCEYNFSSWRWSCSCSKHVKDNSVTNILLMNKENSALKLVDEIILYYDARSKKHQITKNWNFPKTFYLYVSHYTHNKEWFFFQTNVCFLQGRNWALINNQINFVFKHFKSALSPVSMCFQLQILHFDHNCPYKMKVQQSRYRPGVTQSVTWS